MNFAVVEDQYRNFLQLTKLDVETLFEWIKTQPHLPKITELEAIIFLHSCYYSIENSKLCIDTYYTFRTHCPEFFEKRNLKDSSLELCMNTMIFVPLNGYTKENYKVIYSKFHDPDTSKFVFLDALKLFSIVLDSCLLEEGIAEGHVIVVDMHNMALGHITKLSIMFVKKFMIYLQDALPVRLKGFHFINAIPLVDKLMALLRPFIKKELMNVMHFHPTFDTFKEFVPIEMLPMECGGQAGTREEIRKNYYDHIIKYSDYFQNEESCKRVNEKLRPIKPKSAYDLFGVDGHFKTLDID